VPVAALREARRVLRPGGMIGVCSPDWGGALLTPPSRAVAAFEQVQRAGGGDPWAGHKLGLHLAAAGFDAVRVDARFERYPSTAEIAGLLATLLDNAGRDKHARNVRAWSEQTQGAMFARAWISAVAVNPI
jgi:hypothetical protein